MNIARPERPPIEPLEARIAPALLFALENGTNKLVSFDSAAPGTLLSDSTVTGLQVNEFLAGIDFRPSDGKLYAVGLIDDGATRTGRLYTIDPTTAAATMVGSQPFSTALPDTGTYGMDFDPANDQLRLSNSLNGNYRLIVSLNFLSVETALDEAGFSENVVGLAYDRNFNSASTTLYGYNYPTDELVRIGDINGSPASPNTGVVTPIAHMTLGPANYSTNSPALGFDIAGPVDGPEVAWMVARTNPGNPTTHLYSVKLTTAALTDFGTVGSGTRLFSGLTAQLDAAAPEISADGKTAKWTDLDGDLVTLKVSTGGLTAANFRMLAGTKGSALSKLTLTGAGFTGASVTFAAKVGPTGGEGAVNIGAIDATGVDLGAVTIPGDIVTLSAGTAAAAAPSVKALTVHSVNAFGEGLLGGGNAASRIILADGAGKISIAGDMAGALILGKSKTGSITIGGDVIGAGTSGHGNVSNDPTATLGSLVIKGSIRASGFFNVAQVFPKNVGSVTIGGSIIGAGGNASGYVNISGTGKTKVSIGGSIIGGSNSAAGSVSFENIASLKIGGSLIGGTASSTGTATVTGTGSIFVRGDLIGGDSFYSGTVLGGSTANDFLKSVSIGGSVTSGTSDLIISATRIGSLTVANNVNGSAAANVIIAAAGQPMPVTAADTIAIGKVTVLGNLSFAKIIAGSNGFLNAKTADAAIGSVKVGKNMEASSIVAGLTATNGAFGDADDQFVGGNNGVPGLIARIASVTVGGQIFGTLGGATDTFGIEAEQIGAIKVGKTKLPLSIGDDDITIGFTSDVRVREL